MPAPYDFKQALTTYLSNEQIERLQNTTVGIAGCGGLGSNCANALVRSGIGHLVIVDFDVVEASNLNRQAYFPVHIGRQKAKCLAELLLQINPGLKVTVHQCRVTAENATELFAGCKCVVEAFDSPDAKAMLASQFYGSDTFYVTASGLAGYGNSDNITTRQLNETSWMVGDGTSGVECGLSPYAPRVQVTAAKQADIILNHLLT